ncbi:hypothetical protein [Nocardiopsis kunsanensis]|uniref:hypothetical protein n=1 Tax=Nocardiopsis kunsanensis TaxID=141693 RepID=UPI0004757F97|nr:hypothetical protein [Nocardiopsis kunsanensis]
MRILNPLPRIGAPLTFSRNRLYPVDTRRRRLIAKCMPDHNEARAEVLGHQFLRAWYPVPVLHHRVHLPGRSVLVYERLPMGTDRGLLLDLLNTPNDGDHSTLDAYMRRINSTYLSVFTETAELSSPSTVVGKLYRDRALSGGRLDQYYAHNDIPLTETQKGPRLSDLTRTGLYVNGRHYQLDWAGTLSWLREAFDTPVWSVISQGDPTDVNLAVPPAWLDYDTAGRNAIAGEIANFSFYTAVLGGWLVPTLNPQAFAQHPATFDRLPANTPCVSAHPHAGTLHIRFTDRLTQARRLALARYWELLVRPLAARYFPGGTLTEALRPYLVMRIIGVFDLVSLPLDQRLYLLAKLTLCMAPDFSPTRFFDLTEPSCPTR